MSANIFQRQLMARRLLWIMVGPEVLQRLKFPWHKLASRPLPKGWLGTVKPPEPEPEPTPTEPTPEPEVGPVKPEPPEPPEQVEPTPEPEPDETKPTPEPEPEKPKPYKPKPIYVAPWEPGPPRQPTSTPPGVKEYTIYARSDDGYIYRGWRDWPDVRNNANGDALWYQGTSSSSGMATRRQAADSYRIYRSFFSFDLSGLPGRRIRSAVLRLYCIAPTTNNISIQEGTQNIPIVLSDYGGFTGTYFVAQAYRAGLNYLTFNDTGLAYLRSSLGSVAKLCGREYNHDYFGSQPLSDAVYLNPVAYSEWGLSAQRPLLTIVL